MNSNVGAGGAGVGSPGPSVGQAVRGIFMDIPYFTRILAGFLFVLYFSTLIFESAPTVLGLVPGYTLSPPYFFWNIITATYLEEHLVSILVSVVSLLAFGKAIEPVWGSFEYAKYIVGVNFLSATTAFFVVIFIYGFTENESLLYSYHYSGFSAALVALAVALKQQTPDADIAFGFLPLRAKQLPGSMVGLLCLSLVFGVPAQYAVFGFLGLFYGWLYLRHFQKRGETKGDYSEGFAFVSFFPEAIQPVAVIPLNLISTVLRLCSPCFGNKKDEPKVHTFIDPGAVSLSDPADAERRRQRALKVVDTRIAQLASSASVGSSSIAASDSASLNSSTEGLKPEDAV